MLIIMVVWPTINLFQLAFLNQPQIIVNIFNMHSNISISIKMEGSQENNWLLFSKLIEKNIHKIRV